jgi:hypothetical protein
MPVGLRLVEDPHVVPPQLEEAITRRPRSVARIVEGSSRTSRISLTRARPVRSAWSTGTPKPVKVITAQ